MLENSLLEIIGRTDIYLVDQILKGRYSTSDRILDAGCGNGRNLHWFIQSNISIDAVDQSTEMIGNLNSRYPALRSHFQVSQIEQLPYPDGHFDHIISSAVLHFAENTGHFWALMAEHIRVLKIGGSFFIRMASKIGIEDRIEPLGNGVFLIPDGSTRFLLSRSLVHELTDRFHLSLEEPLKTTNVNDIRCMSTLVLKRDEN